MRLARESLPPHIAALRRNTTYPRPAHSIELVQTHMSFVFLVDDEVYKVKKAVDLGFANFSTLEKRRRACDAEVLLNRRGCEGGVYLDVVPITSSGGSFHLGGEGKALDYAVHMKRLPQDRMMDVLLSQGGVDFEMIGRVAGRIAQMHGQAERGARITRLGGVATFRKNWRDNLDQLRPYIGRTIGPRRFGRIEAFARSVLDEQKTLLEGREAEGWIRDCHGDLRSDAVCFDPDVPGGICIYDCIEFNEAFRYSDTGLDAAFLAMDLDYRGRSDLSDLFVGLYAAAIGDKRLPLLLNLFKCYRAMVRGQVESLLMDDPHVGTKQKRDARGRARRYFELAETYARQWPRQQLILVTGPSGSGKSVLAGVLAARLKSVMLSTDMLRLEMFEDERGPAALDRGKYAPDERERVYAEIVRQAADFLAEKRPLVIDGTYIERRQREPFVQLVRDSGVRLLVVECVAPDEVVKARQEQRQDESWTASEGRWEVYVAQKARLEPATELFESERIIVDTTQPLDRQIESVLASLDIG
jgi:aminoglycoside phosphotransferase family enzyme/predicted kinase